MRRTAVAGFVAVVLLAAGCTKDDEPRPPSFTAGADGAGDPYFPQAGNGGYDVGGYDLKLRYTPASNELTGTATITATATQDLSRFNLDLDKLTVSKARVDQKDATFAQAGGELTITPAAGIVAGKGFTVVVDYGGKPGQLGDGDLGEGGWLKTTDGAIALGQPDSASAWYPVNDHPSDKATLTLAMTVPQGVEAISNGVPGTAETANGLTTWHWTEAKPMASYLSTVVIGQYAVTTSEHDGRPVVIAVADALGKNSSAARSLARTVEITDFLATKFGPYPFDAYGGIAVADSRIMYALETQSRPVYGPTFFGDRPNDRVVAHELAHQWFGDSVAIERWRDIWLNEGFATYAEWLWEEHEGRRTVAESFDRTYASYAFDAQDSPVGDPGKQLFGDAVYQRGGMTVYALRKTIGDANFDRLLQRWTSEHRDGNATTDDLRTMAEQISGRDLKSFFDAWIGAKTKPPKP